MAIAAATKKALVFGGGALVVALAAGGASASSSASPGAKRPKPKPKDPALVDALAARLAKDVRDKGYDYSRTLCMDYQVAEGIPKDGHYGPVTASALKARIPGAPDALFRGAKPSDAEALRELSAKVTRDLLSRGYDYDRKWLEDLQVAMGLEKDGIYGPITAEKLRELQPEAPDALFRPKAGSAAEARTAAALAQPKGRRVTTREIAEKAADTTAPMDLSQLTRAQQAEIERQNLALTQRRALRAAQLAAEQLRRGLDASVPIDASAESDTRDASEDGGESDATMGEPTGEPMPVNLELARREAPQIARHLARKRRTYSRQVVRDFQKHAGILPDGIYGPRTRDALVFFGVSDPPEALYAAPAGVYEPT